MPCAQRIGSYKGKPVYRVPVRVLANDSRQCRTVAEARFTVIARSAVEAANWARDQVATRPETEVFAYGPKGGETYRFVGWESAIAAEMMAPRPRGEQLPLFN